MINPILLLILILLLVVLLVVYMVLFANPLYPSTRSYKRQLMESTISDLLDKLDYTGFKYSESKKKYKNLKNMVLTKNEEILFLVNEVASLKREKQNMLDDYIDLCERYQKSKK